ncbi:MAG: hypothetical protein OIF38_16935 [Cellvibrionaceae bacterium]|nr:hypothetical protein [Cellvibrionaceae bacterium]
MIEEQLLAWLERHTGLDAYWMQRPADSPRCVVFRCVTPSTVPDTGLKKSGVRKDLFSIAIYHDSPSQGKQIAESIYNQLHHFHGEMEGQMIQHATYSGGLDRPIDNDGGITTYQFNRDFYIYYTGVHNVS